MCLTRKSRRLRQPLLQRLQQGESVSQACAAVGLSRRTFYRWLQDDPAFDEAVALAETRLIAAAERTLLQAIEQGDTRAAMWVLERRTPEYRPLHLQLPYEEKEDITLEFIEVPCPEIDPKEWLCQTMEEIMGEQQRA